MRNLMILILLVSLLSGNVLAAEEETSGTPAGSKPLPQEVTAPKWEEYVPYKYQNPRDFSRGKSIGELSTGIFLTELIITAPVGIPMIVHSTTKLKNKSYYDKKIKFEQGLAEADKITDPAEKELYYKQLLKECNMSEERRAKQLKKMEKRNRKLAKKQQNNKTVE